MPLDADVCKLLAQWSNTTAEALMRVFVQSSGACKGQTILLVCHGRLVQAFLMFMVCEPHVTIRVYEGLQVEKALVELEMMLH